MEQKDKRLLLDKAPFPQTKIDYVNGATMCSIKKLQDRLQKLKKSLQG